MSDQPQHISFPSPIGPLTVFVENDAIIVIESGRASGEAGTDPLLIETRTQLDAYFDGKMAKFDLPLAHDGTPR